MTLSEKTKAPVFNLPDETGTMRKLEDYLGTPVVLYFYPKDDTPGCTKEACNFRDGYEDYKKNGITILGISPDSSKSHQQFSKKFNLPFTLLADEDHKVCLQYGVWGPKKFMGREYDGVFRTTFLINSEGVIQKVFENVKPENHSAEILKNLFEIVD